MPSTINASTSAGIVQTADTSGVLQLQTANTTAVTIDASQNVGIGTASPTNLLTLFKNSGAYSVDLNGAGFGTLGRFGVINVGTDNTTYIGSISNNPFAFYSYNVERMRLDTSGNLLVGTTSTGFTNKLGIQNTGQSDFGIIIKNTNTSTDDAISFVNNSGTRVGTVSFTTTATTYGTSSDYRLKENIKPMVGALETVSALKPVTYDWKIGGSSQGFIAHELQEVVPECVTGEKDAVDADGNPVYQGIDTSFLVATLTAAIQELNAKVDAQAAEIKALKGVA